MAESLRLFAVDSPDVDRVHRFYEKNYDHHLMPRTVGDLRRVAEDFEVYALEDQKGSVVAAAYVNGPAKDAAPEQQEYEFGGILFDESVRQGNTPEPVAFPFCALVLGTALAQDAGS